MSTPPVGQSSHVDTFTRDHLPPTESWPDLLYDLPELGYPPQLNVATELLDLHVMSGRGDAPAIHVPERSWSYRELWEASNRLARVLTEDLGIVPGNRVMLRAPNNAMMVVCWMAVAKAGGVIVATMPLLRGRELAVIADKAHVTLALCDARLSDEMERALSASTSLERIVYFDGQSESGDAELQSLMSGKTADFETVATAIDDPLLIAFTSGTTGKPKGCVHFHRDLVASADTFFKGTIPAGKNDVFTGTPPIAFTFGLGMHVVFPMRIGASVALIERPSPETVLDTCARFGVSVLSTAPTAYRAMLPLTKDVDLSRLVHCVSAGETLPLPTATAWQEATGLRLIDGIGATELFHIFISAVGDNIRPGATGKPVYGYEAKVFDQNLNEVPRGTVGRLGVRGPTGCRYLDDPRQKDYVQNGWNFTGDAYMADEDGYFWFQARADDMIISSGYNISGPEVEESLLAHDAVADCACVASPDSERGQIVKAFVVLAEGHAGDDGLTRNLQDFVKSQIAPYKYPRAIEFVETLPRTETGKVQRYKLRDSEEKKE